MGSFMERAIFMDVGTLGQCRELHLVCHVLKIGKMTANPNSTLPSNPITTAINGHDSKKSISSSNAITCRRPCAVAAININKLVTRSAGTTQEFEARFHTCDEKEFYQLHETIIKK